MKNYQLLTQKTTMMKPVINFNSNKINTAINYNYTKSIILFFNK